MIGFRELLRQFAELPTPIQALMDIFSGEWLIKSKAVGLGDIRQVLPAITVWV